MIGSNLTRRLSGLGHHVMVVDKLWRGKKEYLHNNHGEPVIDLEQDLHILDLAVPGQIDAMLEGVDYVFHLADIVAGIGLHNVYGAPCDFSAESSQVIPALIRRPLNFPISHSWCGGAARKAVLLCT